VIRRGLPVLALLSVLPAEAAAEAAGSVRASLGGEFDSNAGRVTNVDVASEDANQAPSPDFDVVPDGLLRFIGEGRGLWRQGPWQARGEASLGAKRFLNQTTEDLVASNLRLAVRHSFGPWFVELEGSHRLSRMRRGVRDYGFSQADLALARRFGPRFELEVHAAAWRYAFEARPEFSYVGPVAGLEARLRLGEAYQLSAGADGLYRQFDEFDRTHTEARISAQLDYGGSWLWGLRYLGRFQDSNSVLRATDGSPVLDDDGGLIEPEDVARHKLTAFVAVGLPWRLYLSGTAAVLFNLNEDRDAVEELLSVADSQELANFDENQNQLQIQLRRGLTEALSLEVRYALFFSQFNSSEVNDFVRQTVFLGVTGYLEGRSGD